MTLTAKFQKEKASFAQNLSLWERNIYRFFWTSHMKEEVLDEQDLNCQRQKLDLLSELEISSMCV